MCVFGTLHFVCHLKQYNFESQFFFSIYTNSRSFFYRMSSFFFLNLSNGRWSDVRQKIQNFCTYWNDMLVICKTKFSPKKEKKSIYLLMTEVKIWMKSKSKMMRVCKKWCPFKVNTKYRSYFSINYLLCCGICLYFYCVLVLALEWVRIANSNEEETWFIENITCKKGNNITQKEEQNSKSVVRITRQYETTHIERIVLFKHFACCCVGIQSVRSILNERKRHNRKWKQWEKRKKHTQDHEARKKM